MPLSVPTNDDNCTTRSTNDNHDDTDNDATGRRDKAGGRHGAKPVTPRR